MIELPPNLKAGSQIPIMGMSNPNAGKQSAPTGNYNLAVANILPNNQPYYVPGSGKSTTYAPGVIPDFNAPMQIPDNVYKLGQQHLDAWMQSYNPSVAAPAVTPPQQTAPPPSGTVTPPNSNIGIPNWSNGGTGGNHSQDMWDQYSLMNAVNNNEVTQSPQTGWY